MKLGTTEAARGGDSGDSGAAFINQGAPFPGLETIHILRQPFLVG